MHFWLRLTRLKAEAKIKCSRQYVDECLKQKSSPFVAFPELSLRNGTKNACDIVCWHDAFDFVMNFKLAKFENPKRVD